MSSMQLRPNISLAAVCTLIALFLCAPISAVDEHETEAPAVAPTLPLFPPQCGDVLGGTATKRAFDAIMASETPDLDKVKALALELSARALKCPPPFVWNSPALKTMRAALEKLRDKLYETTRPTDRVRIEAISAIESASKSIFQEVRGLETRFLMADCLNERAAQILNHKPEIDGPKCRELNALFSASADRIRQNNPTGDDLRMLASIDAAEDQKTFAFMFGVEALRKMERSNATEAQRRQAWDHAAQTQRANGRTMGRSARTNESALRAFCQMDLNAVGQWYDAAQLKKMSGYKLEPVRRPTPTAPQALPSMYIGTSNPATTTLPPATEANGPATGAFDGTYFALNWDTGYEPLSFEELTRFFEAAETKSSPPALPPGVGPDYHVKSGHNALNRYLVAMDLALRCPADSKLTLAFKKLASDNAPAGSEHWHIPELRDMLGSKRFESLNGLVKEPDAAIRQESAIRLENTPLTAFTSHATDVEERVVDDIGIDSGDPLRFAELDAQLRREGLTPPVRVADLFKLPLKERRKLLAWATSRLAQASNPLVQEALAHVINHIEDQGMTSHDSEHSEGLVRSISRHTVDGARAIATRERESISMFPGVNLDRFHDIAEELGMNLSSTARTLLRKLRPEQRSLLELLWEQMKHTLAGRQMYKMLLAHPEADRVMATATTYLPDLHRALTHPSRSVADSDRIVRALVETARDPAHARQRELDLLLENLAQQRAAEASATLRAGKSPEEQAAIVKRFLEGDASTIGTRLTVQRQYRRKAAQELMEDLIAEASKAKGKPLTREEVQALNLPQNASVQYLLKPLHVAEQADELRREFASEPDAKPEAVDAKVKAHMASHGPEIEAEASRRAEAEARGVNGKGMQDVANLESQLQNAIRDCLEGLESGTIGSNREQLLAEAAAHEKAAAELEAKAATATEDSPDYNLEDAEYDRAQAKMDRELARLKRSGSIIPPTERPLRTQSHQRRVREYRAAEAAFTRQVGAWSVARVVTQRQASEKTREIEGIIRTLNEHQSNLNKAITAGTTWEARAGGVDAVTLYRNAVAELKHDLIEQVATLRSLSTQSEALTAWDTSDPNNTDEAAARAVMTRYIQSRPNKPTFDGYRSNPQEFQLPTKLPPPAIMWKLRPLAEARLTAMLEKLEGKADGPYRSLGVAPVSDAQRAVLLKQMMVMMANELYKDMLRREKEAEFRSMRDLLEKATDDEIRSLRLPVEERYKELTNACLSHLNEQGRLPYEYTNEAQRRVIHDGLARLQALKDEARDLYAGLLRPGSGEESLNQPAARALIDEFMARASKEMGVSPEHLEAQLAPVREKAVTEHRAKNEAFQKALEPLLKVGFEWDGSGLVYKNARLHEFNSLEKRRELKKMMEALAPYGRYAVQMITPWDELLNMIATTYTGLKYVGAFRLEASSIGQMDGNRTTAVIMRVEGTRAPVGRLPSGNVIEPWFNDYANSEKYFEFADIKGLQAQAAYIKDHLEGVHDANGVTKEKGLWERLMDVRNGYRQLFSSPRLLGRTHEIQPMRKDMRDLVEQIRREIQDLKSYGFIAFENGAEPVIPAFLADSMDARLRYGTVQTDMNLLQNEIYADQYAMLRFVGEEALLEVGTLGLAKAAKLRHLAKLAKLGEVVKQTRNGYRIAAISKPIMELGYNQMFNTSPYEASLPWSQYGPHGRHMGLTFGNMLPIAGALGRLGMAGTIPLEALRGSLGMFGASIAVNEEMRLLGEPAQPRDKAFWEALKMAPLGLLSADTMMIGRVRYLAERPWLAGGAGYFVQAGSGAAASYAQAAFSPEGYRNMFGTQLHGLDILKDTLTNSAVMDGNSFRTAKAMAPILYVKRQMVLHPEVTLKGYQDQYSAKPIGAAERAIEWARRRLGYEAGPTDRGVWVSGALEMMEAREVLSLGERANNSPDANVRTGAAGMVERLADMTGFTGHGVDDAQGRTALVDALGVLQKERGRRVMVEPISSSVDDLRAIGRRQLVARMGDPADAGRPQSPMDLLKHPLFRDNNGGIDRTAMADLPVHLLPSRPGGTGANRTWAFDHPLYASAMREVAKEFGLPTNEFVEFAATYRKQPGDTVADLVNRFQMRDPALIRRQIVGGRMTPSEASRFYGANYRRAVDTATVAEVGDIVVASRGSDAFAREMVNEFARATGMTPNEFRNAWNRYERDLARRGDPAAVQRATTSTAISDPAVIADLRRFISGNPPGRRSPAPRPAPARP